MTEILTFPKQKAEETKRRDAVETLEYILEKAKAGETDPEGVFVIWNDKSEDNTTFKLRYIMGGTASMTTVLSMMEMVKHDMLE